MNKKARLRGSFLLAFIIIALSIVTFWLMTKKEPIPERGTDQTLQQQRTIENQPVETIQSEDETVTINTKDLKIKPSDINLLEVPTKEDIITLVTDYFKLDPDAFNRTHKPGLPLATTPSVNKFESFEVETVVHNTTKLDKTQQSFFVKGTNGLEVQVTYTAQHPTSIDLLPQ